MGNTFTKKTPFGSVYGHNGITRVGYYNNGKKVMYAGKELEFTPDSTIESFKKLKYGYAKNNRYCFYRGKKIPGADPETFAVHRRHSKLNKSNRVIASDKYRVYTL